MKIIPSLTFAGNAEEAINYYKDVFSGEITGIMKYDDMPGYVPDEKTNGKVLHAELIFNDCHFYFVDYFAEEGLTVGNAIQINIDCDNKEQVDAFFNNLKPEATFVMMEPQETFWNAYYADITDKYGRAWSFNFMMSPM